MATSVFSIGVFLFMHALFLAISSDGLPEMKMTSNKANPDFSASTVIDCTFPAVTSVNVSSVISIIIWKGEDDVTPVREEMAAVNMLSPDTANVKNHPDVVATGKIDASAGSFLSLRWDQPSYPEGGRYMCEVNTMNELSEVIKFSKAINIKAQDSLSSDILQRLQDMEERISSLEAKDSLLETSFSELFNILFKNSTVYNDRFYYVSQFTPPSADIAESICETLDGYLAEIDDVQEYDFVKQLLDPPIPVHTAVLLGATDEGHEGRWVNRYSGTDVNFTAWMGGEPSNSFVHGVTEDCLSMFTGQVSIMSMNDVTCARTNEQVTYFLCEVPLNGEVPKNSTIS